MSYSGNVDVSKYRHIEIKDLMIEVTRKCNLQCAHCLRGDAQNININPEILKPIFNKIDYISTLCITGGEPSLNIKGMKDILCLLKEYNVEIGNFYLVTNGLINQLELLHVVIDYIDYCTENEITGIAISHGTFHETYIDEINSPLKYLKFFSDDKEDPDYNQIIGEGRGKDFTDKKPICNEIFDVDYYDYTINIYDMFYINAIGQVLTSCDLSYNSQDKLSKYHVKDNLLFEKILSDSGLEI